MRALLFSALAVSLIGCSSSVPLQPMVAECTDPNQLFHVGENAASPASTLDSSAVHRTFPRKRKKVKTGENARHHKQANAGLAHVALESTHPNLVKLNKTDASPSNKPNDKSNTTTNASPAPGLAPAQANGDSLATIPIPAQADGDSDSVVKKAKAAIAAKLENPTSAQFVEMKRASRMNTLGTPIDTICGYVKAKNASGEDTGAMPFLYLVQENEVYVVDGKGGTMASSVHHNICD